MQPNLKEMKIKYIHLKIDKMAYRYHLDQSATAVNVNYSYFETRNKMKKYLF